MFLCLVPSLNIGCRGNPQGPSWVTVARMSRGTGSSSRLRLGATGNSGRALVGPDRGYIVLPRVSGRRVPRMLGDESSRARVTLPLRLRPVCAWDGARGEGLSVAPYRRAFINIRSRGAVGRRCNL